MTIRACVYLLLVCGTLCSELWADDILGKRRRNRFRRIINFSTKTVEPVKEKTQEISENKNEKAPSDNENQKEPFFMPEHDFTRLALADDLIDYNLSFDENIELITNRVESFRVKFDDYNGLNREFADAEGYLNNDLKMITLMYFRMSRFKGEKRDYYTANGEKVGNPIRYSDWLLQSFKDFKASIEVRAFELALSSTESLKLEIEELQNQVNRAMYELELYAHVSKVHMRKKIEEVPSVENGTPTGRAFWIGFYRKLSFYDYRFSIVDNEVHLFKTKGLKHGTQYSVGLTYIDLRDFKETLSSKRFNELLSLDNKIYEKKFIITNFTLYANKCESYNELNKNEIIELFQVKDLKVVKKIKIVPYSVPEGQNKIIKLSRCELYYSQRKFFKNRRQKRLCDFESRIYSFQGEKREVSLMNCR